MTKKQERLAVFLFGVAFVVVMLALAVAILNPTSSQYDTFRVVLALAAAGIAAFIPGFLEVTVPGWIRAGGALAVFVLVFNKTPANLVVDGPLGLSLGAMTSNHGDVILDFGRVTAGQALSATVDVENLSARTKTITVSSDSATEVTATWPSHEQTLRIPAHERRSLFVSVREPGKPGRALHLREGDSTIRTLNVAFEVVPKTIIAEKASGPKPSGNGGDFSVSYPLCLGHAPTQFTLVKPSVHFWLSGDRTCGMYSHCDPVSSDDSDVCYSFSLQGHSEDGSSRISEGHLHAEYELRPREALLRQS